MRACAEGAYIGPEVILGYVLGMVICSFLYSVYNRATADSNRDLRLSEHVFACGVASMVWFLTVPVLIGVWVGDRFRKKRIGW